VDLISVARVAYRAGWRGSDLTVAVAVARAESGGDPNAHATAGEDSRGLWQINVRAHPDAAGLNLYDPQVNANYAYGLWKRSGWGPWSAHNNGSYLPWMLWAQPAATAAQAEGGAGNIAGTAAGAAGAAGDAAAAVVSAGPAVTGFLQDLEDPVTWQRIALVVVGGALVVGALYILGQSALTSTAARTVKKAIK
jgi:hypothetical protein